MDPPAPRARGAGNQAQTGTADRSRSTRSRPGALPLLAPQDLERHAFDRGLEPRGDPRVHLVQPSRDLVTGVLVDVGLQGPRVQLAPRHAHASGYSLGLLEDRIGDRDRDFHVHGITTTYPRCQRASGVHPGWRSAARPLFRFSRSNVSPGLSRWTRSSARWLPSTTMTCPPTASA